MINAIKKLQVITVPITQSACMKEHAEPTTKPGVSVSVSPITREAFAKSVRPGKSFIHVFCNIFF